MNPVNVQQYDQSIETASDPVVRANLLTMKEIASAYWIDRKDSSISSDTTNPFGSYNYYMNPVNVQQYDQSIETASDPVVRANLLTMKEIASAYWIDRKDK